jgi:hypothetical protein
VWYFTLDFAEIGCGILHCILQKYGVVFYTGFCRNRVWYFTMDSYGLKECGRAGFCIHGKYKVSRSVESVESTVSVSFTGRILGAVTLITP